VKVGHCQAPPSKPSKVFLSRVLFYARLENQGKKEEEELALLLFFSGPAKSLHETTAASSPDFLIPLQIPS